MTEYTTISGTPDEYLYELNQQDSSTLEHTLIRLVQNNDTTFLQGVVSLEGALNFLQVSDGSVADSETNYVNCRNQKTAKVKTLFSTSGANASISAILVDINGERGISSAQTSTACAKRERSRYHGNILVFPLYGAELVGFYVHSISAGVVDVYAGLGKAFTYGFATSGTWPTTTTTSSSLTTTTTSP